MLCWRQWIKTMARLRVVGKAICIVSGGQTGVDRTCLAWAIRRGFDHRGWSPRGGLAEDGEIPARYKLRQTPLVTLRPTHGVECSGQRRNGNLLAVKQTLRGFEEDVGVLQKLWKAHAAPCGRYFHGCGGCRSPSKVSAPAWDSNAQRGRSAAVPGTSRWRLRPIRFGCDFRVYLGRQAR